jgi:myo-inositol 2-dehydrogenase / D-chiro-inositol 1-dehydrogenase
MRFEPVRVGIAGTGFISAVHAACALRSPSVELVAVASARGRATRERVGDLGPQVRLLTLEELVASDEVEAVVICTRTSEHADLAVEVLRAGKHLLLEKPGAATLPEQQRIADEALAHPDVVARVGYMRRHDRQFRELARLIASGAVGEPFALKMASREDFPPSEDDIPAGGFIMDVGVHDFDTARWLLGKDPDTVFTLVHSPVFRDADLDNAYVTIGLDGAVATTHLSRTSTIGMDIRCEVVGPDGSIFLTQAPVSGEITVFAGASAKAAFPADCRERFRDAYQTQIDDFAAACRGHEAPNATLADDRFAVATAVAARASAVRREPLEIGPSWEWE